MPAVLYGIERKDIQVAKKFPQIVSELENVIFFSASIFPQRQLPSRHQVGAGFFLKKVRIILFCLCQTPFI